MSDAGVDAGQWPYSLTSTENVSTMAALDTGDLLIGVLDVLSSQGSILRLAQDGTVIWRHALGMRTPNSIDVSRSDRIIVFANYQATFEIVVLNPDGTVRRSVDGAGRGVGHVDRNELVWGREWRLDDTGTFTTSRLGADPTWVAGQIFDAEDFIVSLGGGTTLPATPGLRAIELDGGTRWTLPVGLATYDPTMDAYQTTIKLGANGAAYVGLASRAGDGGTLTLDVGCGPAGPFSLSAIEQGTCLWTRAWDPARLLTPGEIAAFAPTPDGVVSWNATTLELYDARDGGTKQTFVDGGVLNVAASRVSQTIYFYDSARRVRRAR